MPSLAKRRAGAFQTAMAVAGLALAASGGAFAQDIAQDGAAALAGENLPDIAQALMQAAYDTGDPAEIAAVARAVKAVFPDYAEEIDAQALAAAASLAPDAALEPETEALAEAPPEEPALLEDAAPPPPPRFFSLRPWEGKLNASGLFSDGNSENIAGGLALEGVRKAGPITHNIRGFFDIGRSSGTTNQKRWGASYQLDVEVSNGTYAYSRISYEEDEFSGFDYRIFAGAGLGHFFFDTEPFKWKAEAGPGYRYSPIDDTNEIERQIAAFGSSELDWVIREGVIFEQDLNATWTELTTTFQSVTALNTKLTDAISTGLSFEYRYETDPPEGRENFDTIARASLIYGF